MFSLFAVLVGLASAQVIVIPDNLQPKVRGPIATGIRRLPGGGIGLFAAEDADNIFYPQPQGIEQDYTRNQAMLNNKRKRVRSPQKLMEELKRAEAHRLAQERLYYTKQGLLFGVEDLDDKHSNCRVYHIPTIKPPYAPIVRSMGSDVDALENKPHWSVTIGNEDDLENVWRDKNGELNSVPAPLLRPVFLPVCSDVEDLDNKKINWREIVKIAGQVAQIGGALGFDAEDAEDKKINWREIVKIAGQVHQIGQTLGSDAEDAEDKIDLDEIAKIAGQTEQIIQILKSEDEDFENGLGKKLKKLGRRISHNIRRELPQITNIAGKVAQIGGALGFDAEDLDDYTYPILGMIVHPKVTKPHGPILYW